MSLTSFFHRLTHRSAEKTPSESLAWTELNVPAETKPLDKKVFNALAGKTDLFQGEQALADFLTIGWDGVKSEVYAFATGKKNCLPTYFKRILEAYPGESAKLLRGCFEEMPVEQRLLYLAVCGKEEPKKIPTEIQKILPELSVEEMGMAFDVLVAVPSVEGEDLLCSYLEQEDWRPKMKAASALGEMNAVRCIPQIRQAAEQCDETVSAGLKAIADQLEGEIRDA